jgi:alpha-beta hydrolase superfamily lysophospholipase
VRFESSGLSLDGDLHLPESAASGAGLPGLIVCSGYQGLKDIHPARFARTLVPAGYVCLGFDYRGFGKSEGARGRLVPQEQAEDVRAAVGFLENIPEIDPGRIGLLGWGLGGGVVIAAAAEDSRVRAVVAVNAIGDGERATRSTHDPHTWKELLARIAADRGRENSELVAPFEILRLDGETSEYAADELARYDGFGIPVSLESADSMLRFRPEESVAAIAPRPLLLVHGADNRLNPASESAELYRRAREPKDLVVLDGVGHTEWMYDGNPTFARLVGIVRRFLEDSLQAARAA